MFYELLLENINNFFFLFFTIVVILSIIFIILLIFKQSSKNEEEIYEDEIITELVKCISNTVDTDTTATPILTAQYNPATGTVMAKPTTVISNTTESYDTVFEYDGMELRTSCESISTHVTPGKIYSAKIRIRTYREAGRKEYSIMDIEAET